MALTPREASLRRAQRNRSRLKKLSNGRPRLSVFRSSKNIYAQIIDDAQGVTLAAASTTEADLKGGATGNKDAATKIGTLVAERAKAAGIDKVVFDRGGFQYHGRVAAGADAAREAGRVF
jgi:large subunit ribosomal protein L18